MCERSIICEACGCELAHYRAECERLTAALEQIAAPPSVQPFKGQVVIVRSWVCVNDETCRCPICIAARTLPCPVPESAFDAPPEILRPYLYPEPDPPLQPAGNPFRPATKEKKP